MFALSSPNHLCDLTQCFTFVLKCCRFKSWTPELDPSHFMIDKSDAERSAIEQVFPKATILLCDFHRLQAQQRWLAKSDHDVPPHK